MSSVAFGAQAQAAAIDALVGISLDGELVMGGTAYYTSPSLANFGLGVDFLNVGGNVNYVTGGLVYSVAVANNAEVIFEAGAGASISKKQVNKIVDLVLTNTKLDEKNRFKIINPDGILFTVIGDQSAGGTGQVATYKNNGKTPDALNGSYTLTEIGGIIGLDDADETTDAIDAAYTYTYTYTATYGSDVHAVYGSDVHAVGVVGAKVNLVPVDGLSVLFGTKALIGKTTAWLFTAGAGVNF
ncbi:MAG: hypothetical protein ORN57_01455 [Alphaproteobacteria bacterium]|nr:hypothetical protein [Alphaproteobacteria bacterium]